MEKLKVDDLMNYKFLSGITVSPSGKRAAFIGKQAQAAPVIEAEIIYIPTKSALQHFFKRYSGHIGIAA